MFVCLIFLRKREKLERTSIMMLKKTAVMKVAVLVFALVFMVTACQPSTETSGTPTSKTDTSTKTDGGSQTTSDPSDRYGKYPEPVQVSILQTDSVSASTEVQYDPDDPLRAGPNQNQWIQSYKEEINIELNRIIAEDQTSLNANINTMMASNELPDFMIVDKNMFYTLAENGVLQDVSGAIDSYASSSHGEWIRRVVESYSEDTKKSGQYEGEWLGIPFATDLYNSTNLLWIREDWLDIVGKEAPETIDELVDVATAFKESNVGGENTIGLGVTGIEDDILAAYGIVMDTWMEQNDGSYKYANTLDGMKDGLLKMQELYEKELIKSDFAVTDILTEEVANGQVGMYYAPAWHSVTNIRASLTNDPENARWKNIHIPTLDGNRVPQFTNSAIRTFLVINSNCEYPEALLKMIEFELEMFYNPTPETLLTHFECEDGYLMWNLRPFRNFGMTGQDLYKCEMINSYIEQGLEPGHESINPMVVRQHRAYHEAKDWNGEADESLIQKWGLQYVYTVGYPMVIELRDAGLLKGAYNGPVTENIQLYQETINEALTNEFLKIVMGADISTFDDAVSTWYSSGGQAITDDVNDYFNS